MGVRSNLSLWGWTLPKEVPGCACCECFHLLCICVQCLTSLCAVFVWYLRVHLSGAWLLHRSQLFSVFLPPAYGLLCSQQCFIGFLLMVRAPSAPRGALFVLLLLPFAAAQCMQSWEQPLFFYLPGLITPAWLLPYQSFNCLPFHNLLVSYGLAWLATYILDSYSPHHQAGFLNHTVLPNSVTCSHCL